MKDEYLMNEEAFWVPYTIQTNERREHFPLTIDLNFIPEMNKPFNFKVRT